MLIGAAIYGRLAIAGVWKKYAERDEDIIELRRLCCIDNTPKNTESYFIGHTIRWFKKNTNLKRIISYADEQHGHSGIIYKASNFKHVGMSGNGKILEQDGKTFHPRTINHKIKGGELAEHSKKIRQDIKEGLVNWVDTKQKHVYIYELQ